MMGPRPDIQKVRTRESPAAVAEPQRSKAEHAGLLSMLGALFDDAARLGSGLAASITQSSALLAICGVALEAAFLFGWMPFLSLAGYPAAAPRGVDPLIWRLGAGRAGVDRLLLLLGIAFGPYLLALLISGRLRGNRSLAVAIGGAVVLGLTGLAMFPAGALDIFVNIVTSRLFWVYRFNPMTVTPIQISGDPLFRFLTYWQGTRSPYGPLWFLFTGPAVLAGGTSLMHNIVAFKTLALVFQLACVALIALIVRRLDPEHVTAAVVCFGWNPLVIWEAAGNGHNDILMMAFALLALYLLLTPRWPFAFPALTCSVLIKYGSIVLLPIFVLWILYRHGRRALAPLAIGLIWSVLLAALVFAPFWDGANTFGSLGAQRRAVFLSPASAIVGDWGENLRVTPALTKVEHVLMALFVIGYLVAIARIRRQPISLVRACIEVVFLLLVLVTWWFWPWYVLWGLALAALLPVSGYARLFVLFSASAMLIYVSSPWRLAIWNFDNGFPLALGTVLWVFAPPLLYAAMELVRLATAPRALAAGAGSMADD